MTEASREIEPYLSVGAITLVHTEPQRRTGMRFQSVLRGWRNQQHLILDRPYDGNTSPVLGERAPCVLRFLHEGQACACEASILSWDTHRSYPYMRVSWPQGVVVSAFRKSERVQLRLPCTLTTANGASTPEELRDLSAGGLSLNSSRACEKGESVKLEFSLPDGTLVSDLRVTVRNVRNARTRFSLGCEIQPGQDILVSDLEFFVSSTLARRRTELESASSASVLFIDPDTELLEKVRPAMRELCIELVWVGNVLDACYRMRMLLPTAVMVRQNLPNMTPLEFCRMVRAVRGFEDMDIYVVGPADTGAREAAKRAGATGYVVESKSLPDDLVYAAARSVADWRHAHRK